MLVRFDPFRDFDRLAGEVLGAARTPALMPMDCLRAGNTVMVRFDLPGIDADSLTLTIPVAEQARPRRIEISRDGETALGSHEGHRMISGEPTRQTASA